MGPRRRPVAPSPHRPVALTLNGIDVLRRDGFAPLKDKRVGLITNHTGRDRDGNSAIDLLHKAPGVKLVALFSPEHGIRGALDQANISNSADEKTGLPIYSLYGETKAPTAEMLKEIDALVFDIQDVGARFLHLHLNLGVGAGGGGEVQEVLRRARPRQPDQRPGRGRPAGRRRQTFLHGPSSDPGPATG